MKEHDIFEKIVFVIDCALALFWFVSAIKNMWIGMDNHEAYYLVLAIIEYGFLYWDFQDIKKYLDINN